MLKQIPINLRNNIYTFDNFYLNSQNQLLINNIINLMQEKHGSMLLWGCNGSGKTHLLQATVDYALTNKLSAIYIACADHKNIQNLLFNIENTSIICIDDIDKIISLELQQAMFHLFNNAYNNGSKLLFSSTVHPQNLHLALQDLYSRLRWGINMHIATLNDTEKQDALLLQAKNLGINITEKVIFFLIARYSRNMQHLMTALNVLMQASLSLQRRITIPLVKEVLHC